MSSQVSTFKFQKVTDILSLPNPEWIIDCLLAKGSFAVLFGAPGVGKSFLALAWAFAVAAGESWMDRKVIGGPVIYIAAEGFGGLKLRVTALLRHEDYGDDTPCNFLDRPISLTDSDEVKAFIVEIQKSIGQPALIIIDTLARCFVGGDENSAKDMGLFIHGVETVKRESRQASVDRPLACVWWVWRLHAAGSGNRVIERVERAAPLESFILGRLPQCCVHGPSQNGGWD